MNYQVSSLNAECGMARETGLEHPTMLNISPPELVSLAGRAGPAPAGLRIAPVTPGEEPWPMDRGSPMPAQTARARRALAALLSCSGAG
jgi:hypothetical protein